MPAHLLTTAEEPFIRAIAECPDDDLNRLVYADWLEERCDPSGEFIRVQIQLNRMEENDPRRPPLEERLGELEYATALAAWKGELAKYGFGVRSRRGFVDELVFDLARWPLLAQESSLRFTAQLTRPLLEALQSLLSPARRFAALPATLRIQADWNYVDYGCEREVHVPPDVAADLLALPWCGNLSGLEIANGAVILGPETVRAVVSHPNLGQLRHLSLNNYSVGEGGCQALVSSGRLTSLTSLRLRRGMRR